MDDVTAIKRTVYCHNQFVPGKMFNSNERHKVSNRGQGCQAGGSRDAASRYAPGQSSRSSERGAVEALRARTEKYRLSQHFTSTKRDDHSSGCRRSSAESAAAALSLKTELGPPRDSSAAHACRRRDESARKGRIVISSFHSRLNSAFLSTVDSSAWRLPALLCVARQTSLAIFHNARVALFEVFVSLRN